MNLINSLFVKNAIKDGIYYYEKEKKKRNMLLVIGRNIMERKI